MGGDQPQFRKCQKNNREMSEETVKSKKAAEMAQLEAEMAKRIENQRRASNAVLMAAKEANQGDTKYNHAEARERAAGRKKKAPRRGFVSRETTPADFDQPIRLVKAA